MAINLVLTPDKQPFFAATYIPRASQGGRYGLTDLLKKLADFWTTNQRELRRASAQLSAKLLKMEKQASPLVPFEDRALSIGIAIGKFRRSFDPRFGGFNSAPKFPTAHNLSLLMRLAFRFNEPDAERMDCATLTAIRSGGVCNQIGHGLHRYAFDDRCLVFHFEKMLYVQALFMHAALDAWQYFGDSCFARMVRDTTDYLLLDLLDTQGGFYSGEDADAEGQEGIFYLWPPDDIANTLDAELSELFMSLFWNHCIRKFRRIQHTSSG